MEGQQRQDTRVVEAMDRQQAMAATHMEVSSNHDTGHQVMADLDEVQVRTP